MNSGSQSRVLPAAISLAFLFGAGIPAPAQPGRLDFLKAHDSSYALLANTSATFQSKSFPNELLLITGLPFAPVIAAHVDLGLGDPHCPAGEPCGRLRNLAISSDGDTALVTTDPSDVQDPSGRDVSVLVLLRNIRAFAQSKNKADLRIRQFKATDLPQLDNVSGVAFGPDGRWAVVSTAGPGVLDPTNTRPRGALVVITGLPDNPRFSDPFNVPMHSQGNISLSLDGGTLLLNDTSDRSTGVLRSNQIIVQGIQPGGGPPRVIATSSFPLPPDVTDLLPPVRDAKLTLDGRFVVAPVSIIRSFDANGQPVGYNQIRILGPVRRGALDATTLTESNGVTGGPYFSATSSDGDSALIVNNLDLGGGELLTGLASDNPSRFAVKALPFPFFGPAFPLGPSGPPVLAPHGPVVFTPDGKTALVENWVIPPLGGTPLAPSVSALTGFDTGKVQVASPLLDPILNTFDNSQQIATPPSGLLDYVNLYLAPGATRDSLTSMVNQAIAAADRADPPGQGISMLAQFIRTANDIGRRGLLTASQVTTLGTLAAIGMQALTGPVVNLSAAGMVPGAVAPESIGAIRGLALAGSRSQLTLLDSAGDELNAAIVGAHADGIDYLVPRGAAAGKAIAIVSTPDGAVGATPMEIEPVAPSLFTTADGSAPAALLQRVKANGAQTYEAINGPIDLGAEGDQVFLLLFGTGMRGRTGSRATAHIADREVEVVFAGPQGSLDGVDQVNLRLPRTLAGTGKVDIAVNVDGWDANTVTVNIR